MNPKDFIKNRLRNIYETVKSINIKYEYREFEDAHLIEVTPLSEFNTNEVYNEMERDLLFDFNDSFFPSTILFVSEDSLNKVTSPEFQMMRVKDFYPITNIQKIKPQWNLPLLPDMTTAGESNFALAA